MDRQSMNGKKTRILAVSLGVVVLAGGGAWAAVAHDRVCFDPLTQMIRQEVASGVKDEFLARKAAQLPFLESWKQQCVPESTTNALSGPLANIFRVKKGRLRIYYAASSKDKKIVILYISQTLRKAGDVNDPYSIFTRLVMTGHFDKVFERLGVRIPPKHTLTPPPVH
jgi:mRNA-degrading endonuclease RelE of RelBE toxin-antitoxin system